MSKERGTKRTLKDYFKSESDDDVKKPPSKKRKIDKKQKKNKSARKGHDSHLFTDDNPETTVHGTGFGSKQKALNTIKMMKGRDITYQFQVINTMYYRAKSVLKRTKNPIKSAAIQEAIDTFEPWLNDYKVNQRKNEMMAHLKLDIMKKFEKLAVHFNIDTSYLDLYSKIKGDPKALRISKVPQELVIQNDNNKNNVEMSSKSVNNVTWDIFRNHKLLELKQQFKDNNDNLYFQDSELKGLPSLIHLRMIMFGYSPDSKKNLNKASKIKLPII